MTLFILFSSLRLSVALLFQAVAKKFPHPEKIVTYVFFSKLVCPTITSPFKVVLDESEDEPAGFSDMAAKGLANLATLIDHFASGQEIKDLPSSAVLNDAIRKQHEILLGGFNQVVVWKFIKQVLRRLQDEKTLQMMKKVVQSSVSVTPGDKQVNGKSSDC
jgi:hypothetical protein